ncbi:glycine zipper family protein [Martelella alba]|uniref:Glycine zipper family protein n=1 Tax=Martelella alba TaxID=2590451 RepID=A0ABY2SLP0_9HYPH|nr:glycine zipper family protein [Martelella alba]TKI06109.1 glycine zipper family protein [Martelella alba]
MRVNNAPAATSLALSFVILLNLTGCGTTPPSYPTLTALPGKNKDLNHFQQDDYRCRNYAAQMLASRPGVDGVGQSAGAVAVGTAGGAAAGALIGAASNNAGPGALIGAGSGMLLGGMAAASGRHQSAAAAQQQYDNYYGQCITARGDTIMQPQPSTVMVAQPAYYAPPVYYYAPGGYYRY